MASLGTNFLKTALGYATLGISDDIIGAAEKAGKGPSYHAKAPQISREYQSYQDPKIGRPERIAEQQRLNDINESRLRAQANATQHWAMTGEGPSAAQSLLDRAAARGGAQAAAQAQSMAGTNPALAARAGAAGQAQMMGDAANQAAALRSQEQQAMLEHTTKARMAQAQMYAQRRALELQQSGMDLDRAMAQANAELQAHGINANVNIAGAQHRANMGGGVLGGLGMMFGMLSDRRLKTNIDELSNEQWDDFLGGLNDGK